MAFRKRIKRFVVNWLDNKFSSQLSRKGFAKRSKGNKKRTIGPVSSTNSSDQCISDYWHGLVRVDKEFIGIYNQLYDESSFDPRFITDDIFYCFIDPFYNNIDAAEWLDDKNLYDLMFSDVYHPLTIGRKINGLYLDKDYKTTDLKAIINQCRSFNEVVVKYSVDSEGGKGVQVIDPIKNEEDLTEIIKSSYNSIIQEAIKQHPSVSAIHQSSINTIRVISLLRKGEVHILSMIIRMGRDGKRVDNSSSGGIFCGIDDNGCLKRYAYDLAGNRFEKHPSGVVFEGYQIPGTDRIKVIVKEIALRLARFCRLASWDFAIDEQGNPVFIEVNMSYGGLDFHQMTNGPLFKDLTKDVIQEVFADPKKRFIQKHYHN